MAIQPTPFTKALIRDGIRLVEDVRKEAAGRLTHDHCVAIAAAILSRDAHGERLYETVVDPKAASREDRR